MFATRLGFGERVRRALLFQMGALRRPELGLRAQGGQGADRRASPAPGPGGGDRPRLRWPGGCPVDTRTASHLHPEAAGAFRPSPGTRASGRSWRRPTRWSRCWRCGLRPRWPTVKGRLPKCAGRSRTWSRPRRTTPATTRTWSPRSPRRWGTEWGWAKPRSRPCCTRGSCMTRGRRPGPSACCGGWRRDNPSRQASSAPIAFTRTPRRSSSTAYRRCATWPPRRRRTTSASTAAAGIAGSPGSRSPLPGVSWRLADSCAHLGPDPDPARMHKLHAVRPADGAAPRPRRPGGRS